IASGRVGISGWLRRKPSSADTRSFFSRTWMASRDPAELCWSIGAYLPNHNRDHACTFWVLRLLELKGLDRAQVYLRVGFARLRFTPLPAETISSRSR